MKLVCVLGSMTRPGRLGRALGDAVVRAQARGLEAAVLDLASLRLGFADGRPLEELEDDTGRLIEAVSGADCALLATPVYRATMTGALKNALDLLPIEALMGKPCGIVAMGAMPDHSLGAASHLRDVLAWFGALVAPVDVYASAADFVDGQPSAGVSGQLDELIEALVLLCQATMGRSMGPAPLAARRAG